MSFVELIDLQRYWWHLYIERLDSFEGREVNPPEANYLPELRPTAWERKDLHPPPISFFWDSCYIKLYPTPTPHVPSCWPGILNRSSDTFTSRCRSFVQWGCLRDNAKGHWSFLWGYELHKDEECTSVFIFIVFSSVQVSQ